MRVLGIEGEQTSFEQLPISGVDCGNSAHGVEQAILQCCAASAIETDGVD
jgi:hypothetical protein